MSPGEVLGLLGASNARGACQTEVLQLGARRPVPSLEGTRKMFSAFSSRWMVALGVGGGQAGKQAKELAGREGPSGRALEELQQRSRAVLHVEVVRPSSYPRSEVVTIPGSRWLLTTMASA